MIFYSALTRGFYDEGIHGSRTIEVPDPAWTRPLIDVTLKPGETYFDVTNTGPDMLHLLEVPDWSVEPPLIITPNPHCLIPADANEVPPEEYEALLSAQGQGKEIVPGHDGRPTAANRPPESFDEAKERALAFVTAERVSLLSVLDGLQATASSKGLSALLANDTQGAATHSARATQIETVKQGLKDATTAIAFDQCGTYEEMLAARDAYYAQLVQSAAEDVRAVFNLGAQTP